jgi:hypothetical protein
VKNCNWTIRPGKGSNVDEEGARVAADQSHTLSRGRGGRPADGQGVILQELARSQRRRNLDLLGLEHWGCCLKSYINKSSEQTPRSFSVNWKCDAMWGNVNFLVKCESILLKIFTLADLVHWNGTFWIIYFIARMCIFIETVEVAFFVTGLETLQILEVEIGTFKLSF